MSPLVGNHRVVRPTVERPLSSAHPLVVLAGPQGSGRTTALRLLDGDERAAGRRVTWVDDLPPPDDLAGLDSLEGLVLIDDVDDRPVEFWESAASVVRTRPGVRLRFTCHAPASVPASVDALLVDDLALTHEQVGSYLADVQAAADPRLLRSFSRGHLDTVVRLATSGAETLDQFRSEAALASPVDGLPPDLVRLALPAFLTHAVAAELGAEPDALARIAANGWGYWTGDATSRTFVLLPAVRETALAGLDLQSPAHRAVRELASRVLLAEGHAFAALVEAVRCGSLAQADRAAKLGGLSMLAAHLFEIQVLLRPLSTRQLAGYPLLAFILGLALNAERRNRLRAVELFGLAVVGARLVPGRHPADKVLMRVVESVALRVSGAGDAGLAAARKAAVMLEEMAPDQRRELGTLEPDVHAHAGVTLMYHGHFDEAEHQFEAGLSAQPRHPTELTCLGGLATVATLRGDITGAREWVGLADERTWPSETLDEYPGSLLRIAQAQLALEEFDLPAAHTALDTIWPIIDTIEHWGLLAHLRTVALLAEDRPDEALELLRGLRRDRTSKLGTSDWLAELLDVTEALAMVATGDGGGARQVLRQTPKGSLQLALTALLALLEDDLSTAAASIARMHSQSPQDRMLAAGLKAVLLRRQGRGEESRRALGQVRVLSERYGLLTPLMFLPAEEREHLSELVDPLPQVVGPASPVPVLTPREQVVLEQLVDTADVREVAARLHVSVNTVKSQRRTLFRKLGATSREVAGTAGLVHGLLEH